MPFTHSIFLFYFLPFSLLAMRMVTPSKGRFPNLSRALVFALTLVFYGCKNPWWLIPFLICIGFDFVWARLLSRTVAPRLRKLWLSLSVIQNLTLLGIFKYWSAIAVVLGSRHGGNFVHFMSTNGWLILPPGISFYTFESLSFVIDVYRREVEPPQSPLEFFAFIGMFPRFIAGPIVRYQQMKGQFENYRGMEIQNGLFLFLIGLFLKCGFADSFNQFTPYAFGRGSNLEWASAWVGVVAYAMQIYFDFSGYSLMAIGLGRALGFQFPSNFNKPYQATSVSDFWRRWHMTLSSWLRDYLYIPLGGNRKGKLRTYLNLFATMLIGGIWHGAGLTYVVWGAWHGLMLCLERAFGWEEKIPRSLGRFYTFLLVLVGWVFFKAQSLPEAIHILKVMAVPTEIFKFNPEAFRISPFASSLCLMAVGYLIAIEPGLDLRALETIQGISVRKQVWALVGAIVAILLSLSAVTIPFLYFQF